LCAKIKGRKYSSKEIRTALRKQKGEVVASPSLF
jgi:hypothetical protein